MNRYVLLHHGLFTGFVLGWLFLLIDAWDGEFGAWSTVAACVLLATLSVFFIAVEWLAFRDTARESHEAEVIDINDRR